MTEDGPGLGQRLRYESERISSQHEKLNQLYADVRRELDRHARHSAFVCFGRLRDADLCAQAVRDDAPDWSHARS